MLIGYPHIHIPFAGELIVESMVYPFILLNNRFERRDFPVFVGPAMVAMAIWIEERILFYF